MKKLACLFVLLLTVSTTSFAAESSNEALVQITHSLLTEVYGYTQAEAETFSVHIAQEDDDNWYVCFYLHPNWVYSATIRKKDPNVMESHSPFSSAYKFRASENSVRDVLRAIGDNGWFENWSADSKAALDELIAWCGDINVNASMQRGLSAEAYTPAQALDDFFLSCYGDAALWSQPVAEWRDAVFFSFGLTRGEEIMAMPQGIQNRVADEASICEFVGEVPDALLQAFSVSQLEGWECLAGVYRISSRFTMDEEVAGTGLAAFAYGEERLLAMLYLDAKTQVWQVIPVSKAALLPGRELYITYVSGNNRFNITYPVSDTEQESFQCRLLPLGIEPTVNNLLCELMEYSRINLTDGQSIVIEYSFNNPFSGFYVVSKIQNGNKVQTRYPALASNLLDYIDVSAFPKTEEACKAASEASAFELQGYGFSFSVHLRAKPSSHSDDLGMYRLGTLVEVLDTQPGSAFPWLHVRIGQVEGYMSSNYVAYQDNTDSNQRYIAQGMAKVKKNTALMEHTGIFAKTVADLPKGTIVRVLAERGSWLHVSLPFSQDDWMMQPGEINGYVRADAVVQAATALQLEWLMPEE